MKLWWCMECRAKVEWNRPGRCEICDSDGVDLLSTDVELSLSASTAPTCSDPASTRT
jgi:hypothetical protein